jgi:hypothetical protein
MKTETTKNDQSRTHFIGAPGSCDFALFGS